MKMKILLTILCLYVASCVLFYLWRTRIPRYFAHHGVECDRSYDGWWAYPVGSVTNFDWATPRINITHVDISQSGIRTLDGIERLLFLTYFRADHSPIRDISPLLALHRLEFIDLSYSSVTNLTPLRDIRSLRELKIQWIPCRNLDGIPTENLEFLELSLDGPPWSGVNRLKRDFSGKLMFHSSLVHVPYKFDSLATAWEFFDKFNGTLTSSVDTVTTEITSP